jgi:hypothetical protein
MVFALRKDHLENGPSLCFNLASFSETRDGVQSNFHIVIIIINIYHWNRKREEFLAIDGSKHRVAGMMGRDGRATI